MNESTEYRTTRNGILDIVAGILIVRMILGHYLAMAELGNIVIAKFLNCLYFYMPWFYFKSGMFSQQKSAIALYEGGGKILIYKYIRKLIIPFVFFSIFGCLLGMFSSLLTGGNVVILLKNEIWSFIWHGSTNWNAPLWFLLSLFFVKVSYNYFSRFNSYVVIIFLLILAQLHNWYLADKGFWWIGNYSSGMIFFILGSKMKDLQYNKYTLLISLFVVIAIGIIKPTFVTMFGNYDLYGNGAYLLWYPFCLAGIVVFNNFILFASKVFKFYNFETVGRYSIGFYVIHYPLGLLICNIYKLRHSSINEFELLFYLCLVWLLFIPLLVFLFNTNKFSKFIGKASYEK